MTQDEALARIAELENEVRDRDQKLQEMRDDLDEARNLVDELREVAERNREILDSWISTFDLQQDESGVFQFDKQQTDIWDALADLWDKHKKLVRTWNGAVADFNAAIAPKDIGRPLAASEAQKADVLKRHKAGESIRGIAAAMSLGISTVRTIIDKPKGADRASRKAREFRRIEFNRIRAAAFRSRKRDREALPRAINDLQKDSDALVKQAKGLGRARSI